MNSSNKYDGRENVFRITEWFSVCLNFIAKLCDLVTVATETSELFRNTSPVFGKYKHKFKNVPYLKQLYLNIPSPGCLRM